MNVVIGDSNDIIRLGLKTVLATDKSIKIVGEATNNEEFIQYIENNKVNVAVLDYTAPDFSIDVVPEVLRINKNLKIVAITPEQNPNIILDALRSGVKSYVKKDCDLDEILDSVQQTYHGNHFFCGKIMNIIRKASIDVQHLDDAVYSCLSVSLSERELEVIKYIAEGNTNVEIAKLLFLSPHTVNTHRKNIMTKLGIKNTAGIVMYAVKSNIVSPNKFIFSVEN
ncbi:MAG: response regulator transcription factor [Brumimicrobium sp.]